MYDPESILNCIVDVIMWQQQRRNTKRQKENNWIIAKLKNTIEFKHAVQEVMYQNIKNKNQAKIVQTVTFLYAPSLNVNELSQYILQGFTL